MAETRGTGGQKRTGKEQLKKHYPWMEEFDNEAKVHMAVPEVRITHVLKLITMLERNVSPEVSKLKSKPNRATKFIKEIRKRISLTKIGGFLTENQELERKLGPTYGLLMTHLVNIYLISSKLEKEAPQKIASELYYILKLMFEDDPEYILDVLLCSNMDEHASSKVNVGFQIFSFVVEDWRPYSNSHPLLMKYCAVCAILLDEARQDGRQVVESHIPAAVMDKSFVVYLRQTLDIDFGREKLKNAVAVIRHIKPTTIKSFSRSRLVVVSTRDIAGGNHGDGDSVSSESSSSTVSLPSKTGNVDLEQVSSSSASGYLYPMNPILRELGLGEDFFLDTGHGLEEDCEAGEYLEAFDQEELDAVSSSTRQWEDSSSLDSEGEEEIDQSPGEPISKKKKTRNDSEMSHQSEEGSQLNEHELDDASDNLNKFLSNLPSGIPAPSKDLKEVDSDVEVVSVVDEVGKKMNDSKCSSIYSRDEAEAESEDVVPNYDVDNDLEEGQSAATNEDGAVTLSTPTTMPEDKTDKSESKENVVDNIVINNVVGSFDEYINSILTTKLDPSPVKSPDAAVNVKPTEKEPSDQNELDNTKVVVPATANLSPRTDTSSSPIKLSPVVMQTLTVTASPLPGRVKADPEEENEDVNDVFKSSKRPKMESKTGSKQNANADISQEKPDKKLNKPQTPGPGESRKVSCRMSGNKSISECESIATATSPVVILRRITRATTAAAAAKKLVCDNDSNGENPRADGKEDEEVDSPAKKTTRKTTSPATRGRGGRKASGATPATKSSRRK